MITNINIEYLVMCGKCVNTHTHTHTFLLSKKEKTPLGVIDIRIKKGIIDL